MSGTDTGSKNSRKKARRQRREKGRLHLSLQPSGIWHMRGTVAGVPVNETTGVHSEEHAKAIRDRREKEILDRAVYGREMMTTFQEAVDSYHTNVSRTNSTCRHLGPILKEFGPRKMREIKVADITELAKKLYPNAKNTTRNTNVINPIRTIWNHAAEQELCDLKKIPALKDDSEKVYGAPQAWMNEFFERCENQQLKAAVAFMSTTAARTIEMCRLRWEDIDLSEGRVMFTTKTGEIANVLLAGWVLKLIEELPRQGSRVFGYASTNSFNVSLDRQCDYLKIEHMSGHRVGRHFFAEYWLAKGYDCYTVCRMGRWESVEVFTKRYGHLEKKKLQETMRDGASEMFKPKLKIVGGNG